MEITNVRVTGFEAAIRGMRNPMNSWYKSDTIFELGKEPTVIGPKDWTLMKQLRQAGSDHRKFMRMIVMTCDIVAPLYWWKEFDTYKVGTIRNSSSTMHKLTSEDITLKSFGWSESDPYPFLQWEKEAVDNIRTMIDCYNNTSDADAKSLIFQKLIELLPSGYMQRSTIQVNYETLISMYQNRRGHKLKDWHIFCSMIEELPHSRVILGKDMQYKFVNPWGEN